MTLKTNRMVLMKEKPTKSPRFPPILLTNEEKLNSSEDVDTSTIVVG